MDNFKLTILGSSGALPAYGRFPSAQHLSIQNHNFLIDSGEGVQLQLSRYGISSQRISHVFISHMHGDHYLGLAGLIFSMHLQRRESDLHIYSFSGLEEILLAHLKHARSVLNFKIIFHTLSENSTAIVLENDTITVETFPMDHKIPTQGFIYREKTKSLRIDKSRLSDIPLQHIARLKRGEDIMSESGELLYRSADFTLAPKPSHSYAYCSDTQPKESIIERIHGVDLLYHEATFMEDEKEKARETKHSTAAEAALVAARSNAKKLIIGHFSARYRDLAPVLAEAQRIFPDTALAIEGETFELSDK